MEKLKYAFLTCVVCGHEYVPILPIWLILHVHVSTLKQVSGAALPAA